MAASTQNLFDELRKIGAATDAQRDPPALSAGMAGSFTPSVWWHRMPGVA